MATYKSIHFPDHVAPLVRHMGSLNNHRETLATLSGNWDTLSLLGHLSNLKTDMVGVRQGFVDLTGELLSCLAEETLAHVTSALNYQAQIAMDVLTRNLFERTADIGFLATDFDVVSACVSGEVQALAQLRQRFTAYAANYTVYKDIVLMRPDGQVIARMRDGFMGLSASDIVTRSIATTGSYVETYAPTDFCGGNVALTYACRVESAGQATGILALEFDVQAEVQTILACLGHKGEMVAFLGKDGRVLLSNDPVLLPTGYLVPACRGASSLRLGGVQYIVAQRSPQPYQGYAGPGWSAMALLVAEMAFEDDNSQTTAVNFSGENVFSRRLLAIPEQARQIQHRLDRLVWNGRVQQADDSNLFSRSLLEEIANTGRKTKCVFERSSGELLSMVASSLLNEAQFLAGLSVDLLDRNLYERANDCRWWAASPALATLDAQTCRQTLNHINGLYTVYANLFVFDRHGVVIASSQDARIEGQKLSQPWVAQCLGVRDASGYVVSPFECTALYAGKRTYIFSAPIMDDGHVTGGVGVVFDSAPQLAAMLEAVLPPTTGAMALFCRPDGTAISQTAELLLTLPPEILNLEPGQRWSGVLTQLTRCYSVGATASSGYREFKTTDGYVEPIIGVIVVPCGSLAEKASQSQGRLMPVDGGTEIATFYVDQHLMGILAKEVIECIEVANAVRTPNAGSGKRHVGYATWGTKSLPLVDLRADLGGTDSNNQAQRHALVLRHGETDYGLLVSGLGPVMDMHVYNAQQMASLGGPTRLYSQIARAGDVLVPILSASNVLISA